MGSGEQALEPKHESAASPRPENLRPDALFSGNTADPSIFNNAIAMLLGNGIDAEYKPVLGDGIVLDSSSWNNMQHAFQMAGFK
jgi:transcription factor MYB, plant